MPSTRPRPQSAQTQTPGNLNRAAPIVGEMVERKTKWGQGAEGQMVVVGVLAFCGPGLFNALNGLGNAGSNDPTVAAAANGCLYCTFALCSCLAGAAFNVLGPVALFSVGGATFAVYAICVYFSARYRLLAVFGGVVLGCGAGLFWTAQGSLMMAYATPQSRGRLIGIFWMIFNLGGVAGGLLQFGLNFKNNAGIANPASYFTFIVAMLSGAALAPCLLMRPALVVREDGSSVTFEQAESPLQEIRATFGAFKDPFVRRCLLFFFASNWFYTYDFSGFNGTQFNVRTRGLNSAFFWAAQMLAAWRFGKLLDAPRPAAQRAAWALQLVVCSLVVSLGLAAWSNFRGVCNGGQGWDKAMPCALDFSADFPKSVAPMAIFALLGAADAMYQNFAYWLMSIAAGGAGRKMVMYSAIYKAMQSLGAGAAWLSDLSTAFSYQLQVWVALVLTTGACVLIVPTLSSLSDAPTHETEFHK